MAAAAPRQETGRNPFCIDPARSTSSAMPETRRRKVAPSSAAEGLLESAGGCVRQIYHQPRQWVFMPKMETQERQGRHGAGDIRRVPLSTVWAQPGHGCRGRRTDALIPPVGAPWTPDTLILPTLKTDQRYRRPILLGRNYNPQQCICGKGRQTGCADGVATGRCRN